MAITISNIKNVDGTKDIDFDFKGLSTDTKPVGEFGGKEIAINSLFLELDTGDFYYYDGEDWSKVGE